MIPRLVSSSADLGAVANLLLMQKPQKFKGLVHSEGRTRSLQIAD
jgi:hypothetical protein